MNLFARHLSMLIYPHDLKAIMRRTLGDPRLVFMTLLCIDVLAFAALLLYVVPMPVELVARSDMIDAFGRVVVDLVSASGLRALIDKIEESYNSGLSAMLGAIPGLLSAITWEKALEMTCSGFIYLNLVRMAYPLSSWRTTDEDRKSLARGFVMMGLPEQARACLDQIKNYDVETGRIDALLAATRGDFTAARHKAQWANSRDGLGSDPDLAFLDTIMPSMAVLHTTPDMEKILTFSVDHGVSDSVLAIGMFWSLLFERMSSEQAGQLLASGPTWTVYPLSATVLRLGAGNVEGARSILDSYRPSDLVSECAALLLAELVASTGSETPAPSIHNSATRMTLAITDAAIDAMQLGHGLALITILNMLRMAVICAKGDAAALRLCSARLIARLRERHPGHHDSLAFLENYGRMAELQVRHRMVESAA